jgi:hypothetical protein
VPDNKTKSSPPFKGVLSQSDFEAIRNQEIVGRIFLKGKKKRKAPLHERSKEAPCSSFYSSRSASSPYGGPP